MKNFYYVSDTKNSQGECVVHTMDCTHLPPLSYRTAIGLELSGSAALRTAKHMLTKQKQRLVTCPVCCAKDMRQMLHLLG